MRIAASLIAMALTACEAAEQPANSSVNASLPVEVETLPPDESVGTTSEELARGVNDPDGGNLGNQH